MVRRDLTAVRVLGTVTLAVLAATGVDAQSPLPGSQPPPPGMTMPVYAQHRFPQPVPVGQLLGAVVERPVESHARLGIVRAIVRAPDGTLDAVLRLDGRFGFGLWSGFGGRAIVVPLDAMALLGRVMEVVGFTAGQLDRLPTDGDGGDAVLPADAIVRVGLTKPPH